MTSEGKPKAQDGFVRGAPPDRRLARRSLKLLAAGAVLALIALSQLGENGLVSWFQLRGQNRQLREGVAAIERENESLRLRVDELAQNEAALEKLAREKFNMRGPDEEVLLISPGSDADRNPVPDGRE